MSDLLNAPKATRRRSSESQAQFRAELVAYAKEVYRTRGLDALTVRALTDAFGMSPMAFYAYFPTKHDLIKHIWVDIYREALDTLLAAGRGARSPIETLRAHVQANLDYWESHGDHFRMVYLSQGDEPASDPVGRVEDPLYAQIMDLLRERVVACAGARQMPEASARLVTDFIRLKMFGYLFGRVATQRFPIEDPAALKRLVVEDAVQTVERATG